MKTIFDKTISLPLRKNCRVDCKYINGSNYSFLVDYTSYPDTVIYSAAGYKSIGILYNEFKFKAINELPVDNWNYTFLPYEFKKIDNIKYDY